ncbi:hypothetical protein [Nocardia africana]|uniref:Uncharacterized protein n=1 Tax=Nocardia africana TaxID=134964 RepID=A0ABW6NTS4_9NOCA
MGADESAGFAALQKVFDAMPKPGSEPDLWQAVKVAELIGDASSAMQKVTREEAAADPTGEFVAMVARWEELDHELHVLRRELETTAIRMSYGGLNTD